MTTRRQSQTKTDKAPLEKNKDDLEFIRAELVDLKKQVLKREDIKETIRDVVKEILKDDEHIIANKIDEGIQVVEKRYSEKVAEMTSKIDGLILDNNTLRESINKTNASLRKAEKKLQKAEFVARDAMRKSNYNEQYSRKNNIKIYGVSEAKDENTEEVVEKVLIDKMNYTITKTDITAVHRIPGKQGQHRPILLKMKNNNSKAEIMRKWAALKKAKSKAQGQSQEQGQSQSALGGFRLANDITKLNANLITTLLNHPDVTAAWYFNGSVYAEHNSKRMKFDIPFEENEISKKLKSAAEQSEPEV